MTVFQLQSLPLVIDGTDEYGNYSGGPEGFRAPFAVFSPDLQENLAWQLPTRQAAEDMRHLICKAMPVFYPC